jgi:hypothetical protein
MPVIDHDPRIGSVVKGRKFGGCRVGRHLHFGGSKFEPSSIWAL